LVVPINGTVTSTNVDVTHNGGSYRMSTAVISNEDASSFVCFDYFDVYLMHFDVNLMR